MTGEAVAMSDALLGSGKNRAGAETAEDRFDTLYQATLPRVYAFLRSQLGSVATAQDLTGRVYLKVYQHRQGAPSGAQGALWVFRIARNTLIDYRRVEGRYEAVSIALGDLEFASTTPDPETAYATKERQALLLGAIGELDESDRVVLGLKFAGQRSNGDIADILKISSAAVSMRLLRALRRLRRRLDVMGVI